MKTFFKIIGIVLASIIALSVLMAIFAPDSMDSDSTRKPAKQLSKAQQDSVARAELIAEIEMRKKNTSTPAGLVSFFEENEVKASQEAKGKTLIVEGTIESIGLDIMDNPYIVLSAGDGIRSVQCSFDDKNEVASLSKGEQVTVQGVCQGLMVHVQMDDCKLIESIASLRKRLKALKKA